ncbi:serine protease [Pilimelia anulata]|uniref:Serine protease n=1 Tax=Pilimelia anulata TaxID=53371 RepID=A0A8J3AZA0_9ACTN|nr:trypsin-like serine protease [Pilimelia anulata]GGJ78456.1 serine protease [Pilimelia anulata]
MNRRSIRSAGLAIAVAGALGVAGPGHAADDPAPGQHGIVNGKATESAPWAVQFYRGNGSTGSPVCSASLVAADWVLVADHCLTYQHTGRVFSVRIGSLRRGEGTLYQVETFKSKYDVTLMKLASAVPNAPVARVADAAPATGAQVEIYGWGRTCPVDQQCDPSPVLKQATVRVSGSTKDVKGGPAFQLTSVTGNASKGDSGGPARYNDLIVGVASTATSTTSQYSNVTAAATREWIKSTAGV